VAPPADGRLDEIDVLGRKQLNSPMIGAMFD
jgi:hypothetical protein